ncbi:unnamed protein product [Toxocara canis]|uniref:Transmembrane protein n=1 Tax=Toxocara canis TaxID=6265 RepID=A0A183VFY8_TOXCA|nr:unnamed protein product [Toxocara canis]
MCCCSSCVYDGKDAGVGDSSEWGSCYTLLSVFLLLAVLYAQGRVNPLLPVFHSPKEDPCNSVFFAQLAGRVDLLTLDVVVFDLSERSLKQFHFYTALHHKQSSHNAFFGIYSIRSELLSKLGEFKTSASVRLQFGIVNIGAVQLTEIEYWIGVWQ